MGNFQSAAITEMRKQNTAQQKITKKKNSVTNAVNNKKTQAVKNNNIDARIKVFISDKKKDLDLRYSSIQDGINFIDSQKVFKGRLQTLENDYNDKISTTSQELSDLNSKTNISNRLTTFYSKDIEWRDFIFKYIWYFYWILTVVIIFRLIWRKISSNEVKISDIITPILLVIVPLIIFILRRLYVKFNINLYPVADKIISPTQYWSN